MENYKRIFSLDGKAGLVTGGGSGLGKGIAQGFAQYGAAVAVVDINYDAACQTAEEIRAEGGQALPLRCDVTQPDQVAGAVLQAVEAFGKLDILAAVAGIGDRNLAEDMTLAQWDRVIDINLKGVWLFNQAVGKQMIAQGGGGSIINMGSVAAQVGLTTGNANYAAAKGGVIALTRLLAVEWARFNIRVNAIAPAQFKTPLIIKLIESKPETLDYFLSNIPLSRLGEIREMVGPAVFLASSASSMVTGAVLNVDGGYTAH